MIEIWLILSAQKNQPTPQGWLADNGLAD